MRIAICDDNNIILNQIEKYITEYFQSKCTEVPAIERYNNGDTLLEKDSSYDIVFLDIEMPGANGIYVGNTLSQRNTNIIIFIISSYMEYLDDAMRFHVFRYLSKPIEKNRFFRNLQDALRLYHSANVRFTIETKSETHTISADNIIFFETDKRNTKIYTTKDTLISNEGIKYWIDRTSRYPCFYMTHKSYIINMRYVSSFSRDTITLYGGKYTAYLAKRRYKDFRKTYLLYLDSIS